MRLTPVLRTVRFKLTLWYSSLLLVFGLAFVIALNIAVRLDEPPHQFVVEGIPVDQLELRAAVARPGGAMDCTAPVMTSRVLLQEAEDQIASQNLDRLRTWSILAVVGLAVTSGIGGYVLSGMMLRPVRDITEVASEISATNLSRRIHYQGPEDELKQLADTFDSMIGRIQAGFESQRRFVQDASHELRTPLAAIRTNIDVLEMDDEATPEEYRGLLETVKHQTERLTRLSEDLLLLTTSDGEPPDLEPVDVGSIARTVADELAPLAARRSIRVRVDNVSTSEALASPDLLYRCLMNLVDNAVKYSGEGGAVSVRVANGGGGVTVDVKDSGPGIPAEALPHVFDRFYRVDKARDRRRGGSGLGLAIVKELTQAMGGTVSVESMPGRGATFTLSLRSAEGQHQGRP